MGKQPAPIPPGQYEPNQIRDLRLIASVTFKRTDLVVGADVKVQSIVPAGSGDEELQGGSKRVSVGVNEKMLDEIARYLADPNRK